MRTFDLDPFWRTSVGFDRLFHLMDESLKAKTEEHYPPYDITRLDDDKYRISLAVAGFTPDQITITAQQNTLTVAGRVHKDETASYLYRGIAARAFERQFNLADHVEVTGAALENGLLMIDLERRVPEAMKPRRIEIGRDAASGSVKSLERKAA